MTQYKLRGPHSFTLMLDGSIVSSLLSIDSYHNDRIKERSFSFTCIGSTTDGEVGVIVPSLAEEEVAKIFHDPKLPTGLNLEDYMVEDFRIHPSLEGETVIKGSHGPIRPKGLLLEDDMVVVIPRQSLHPARRLSLEATPHQS